MDNLYSSFYLYKKYEIIGDELIDLGITSIDADGTQEAVVKEECDPACGCPEPIYRWVQTEDTVCVGEEPAVQYRWTPSGWTCVGYDKYQNNIKEQSLDEGLTWTVVIPEEYSASTLIESQSTDCGYVPPTPTIDGKFKLTLSDSSTVTAECNSTSSVTSGEVATQYSGSATPALVEAEIGDCVKTIGGGAFYNCSGLTSVTISDNVKSISGFAFGSCTNLVTCNMGTGVTKMGSSVFQSCHSLTGITIPNGVTSIKMWTFYQCYSLTSITIPNSVTSIDNSAFNHCTGLTGNLLIPDSVTSISDSAFSWCKGLSAATIGSGITTIGRYAFLGCSSLVSITINTTTPPALGEDPFSSTNKCPIYVPSGSVNVYKSAEGWSTYASRIQAIP